MENKTPPNTAANEPAKRPYEAPEVMVMDEKEVLKVFQVTSAGVSWWA
ncbi:MAG: hypothetical protein ABI587_09280 [Gemmatimonadales bacterium]